jgi:hypothetical protein
MRAALPAVLGVLFLAGPARADDSATAPGPPAPAASPAPAPRSAPRLNLGPYRSVSADDPSVLADQLRFQEHVEVRGKAMDTRSLTMKMEWWMKDFEPMRGATPASMSAPSIAEMREYRPHPPDSLNLVPVMQWLTEKLSGKKKD